MTNQFPTPNLDNLSGSPVGEPLFLIVGKILHPHGLHGEILMQVITDFPERLKPGIVLYAGSEHQPFHLRRTRNHKNGILVAFEEFSTPEEVGSLRNQYLFVRSDNIPGLPDGDFYHHQIIGLHVFTIQGQSLGRVVDILETGANDVLIVNQQIGEQVLIPFVDEFVANIDLEESKLIVKLIPGLLGE